MKNFLIAWQAVDQHVAFALFLIVCACITGWVLYGEHKYGGDE